MAPSASKKRKRDDADEGEDGRISFKLSALPENQLGPVLGQFLSLLEVVAEIEKSIASRLPRYTASHQHPLPMLSPQINKGRSCDGGREGVCGTTYLGCRRNRPCRVFLQLRSGFRPRVHVRPSEPNTPH